MATVSTWVLVPVPLCVAQQERASSGGHTLLGWHPGCFLWGLCQAKSRGIHILRPSWTCSIHSLMPNPARRSELPRTAQGCWAPALHPAGRGSCVLGMPSLGTWPQCAGLGKGLSRKHSGCQWPWWLLPHEPEASGFLCHQTLNAMQQSSPSACGCLTSGRHDHHIHQDCLSLAGM